MAEDAWQALNAERRALRRATDGARLAAYVWQDAPPHELILRQIEWARIGAFPRNTLVNEFTQPNILRSIATQDLFTSVSKDSGFSSAVVETVPLSQISEGRLLTRKGRGKGAGSDGSSSWVTLSSNGSSFSHVSGSSSLDGELVSRFGVM